MTVESKSALRRLTLADAPHVHQTELAEHFAANLNCVVCGGPTAAAALVERIGLRCARAMGYVTCPRDDDDSQYYLVPAAEQALAEAAYADMREQALYTYGGTGQRRTHRKGLDGQGNPYWLICTIRTAYYHQVCPACFVMEPALAEAQEQGWRYTTIAFERCRCGRVKPECLSYCVYCWRELRMLEAPLAGARRNRRLIQQLQEALRHAAHQA